MKSCVQNGQGFSGWAGWGSCLAFALRDGELQQDFLAQRASCEHGVDRSAAREICVRKRKIAVGEKKSENLAEPPNPPRAPTCRVRTLQAPARPETLETLPETPQDSRREPPREIFRDSETPREHPRDTPGGEGGEGQSKNGSRMVVSRDMFNTWIWNEDGFRSPR